jgi:hypothetical protein
VPPTFAFTKCRAALGLVGCGAKRHAACTADELAVLVNRQQPNSQHSANRDRRKHRAEYPGSGHLGGEPDNAHGLNVLSALVAEGWTPSWSFCRLLSILR